MTRLTIGQARNTLSDTLNRVAYRGERILLRRRGKDIAALVPVEDLEILEKLQDRVDVRDARAALKEVRRKGTVPWTRIKADLGL